jgi:hypothetical protein
MNILATTLAEATPFSATMKSLNLSSNKCFGQRSRDNDGGAPWVHDVDMDQTGWRAICQAFKGTTIETLVLSDIGAGPVALPTLADAISDMAALSEVNLSGAHINESDIVALRSAAPNISFSH